MLETWEELKKVLRRRYVPSHYHREFLNELQRITQGSKSVDEFYKDLEIALIRANVEEEMSIPLKELIERKIKLDTLEFTDYALVWWDQFQRERKEV